MNPIQPHLTKTTYLKLLQCEKALYLNANAPQLKDPSPPELKHRYQQGNKIGTLAQQLFPNGTDISKLTRTNAQRLQLTSDYLNQDDIVLYEATLAYQNLLVMVDILVKSDTGYNAYEVKSSTRISETFKRDAELQYWVLQHSLNKPVNMHIVHINPDYILQKPFDINAYFKIIPVTITALDHEVIHQTLQRGLQILQSQEIPQVTAGKHCTKPYRCDFYQHCNPISNSHGIPIPQMPMEVKNTWTTPEIKDFMQLPEMELPHKYQRMYRAVKSQTWVYDSSLINSWLKNISCNVIAMDIETWTSPIPEIENTKAWDSIPFLAAVYGKDEVFESVFVSHIETDERYHFTRALLKLTEGYASVLVYDKTLETQTLLRLGALYPDLNAQCKNLCDKFIDVFEIFKSAAIYHPDFKHQFNLKQVSRVLNPHLKTENPIQHGVDALIAFQNYRDTNNPILRDITETDLKNYCINDARMTFELYNSIRSLSEMNPNT